MTNPARGKPASAEPVRLTGGYVHEVVRIGDTVRRKAGERMEYVHRLLAHLERAGYQAAPRFLGMDDAGREVLSFIEGSVPEDRADEPAIYERGSLEAVARLVRRFHDCTVGTPLAAEGEVVCHNDLSPRNTVYDRTGGWWRPKAFIDWDLAGPGLRIHDVAHMCWQYPNLGPHWSDPREAGQLIRIICDAYGEVATQDVIPAILWWQNRCWQGIERLAAQDDPAMRRLYEMGGSRWVREAEEWVQLNRGALEEGLRG